MAISLENIRGGGSRFSRFLLAGTLAAALTPAMAFAADGTLQAQELGTQSMEADSAHMLAKVQNVGTEQKPVYDLQWPDGKWEADDGKANADGSKTYTYQTYVKGDNAHYGHYDMDISFTVKNDELTSVDMTSKGTVFGGKWCTLTPHSGAGVVGLLPNGVTSTATQNGETISTIGLEGAGKSGTTTENRGSTVTAYDAEAVGGYGGYTLTSVNLYKVDANGNIATKKVQDPKDGDWEDVNIGFPVGYKVETTSKNGTTTTTYDLTRDAADTTAGVEWTAGTNTLKYTGSEYNVASATFKIGDYYVFEERFALDDSAEAKAYAATKTDIDGATVSGIGAKNRDTYSGAAFGIIMQNELPSWIKSAEGLRAYYASDSDDDFDAKGELSDIDIVSAATKTSDGIIEAIYASQGMEYRLSNHDDAVPGLASGQNALFSKVSDKLALTIDGVPMQGDATYVTKDAAGNRVLHSALFNDKDLNTLGGEAAAVPVAGFDLYRVSDTLGAAAQWGLTKVGPIYQTKEGTTTDRNGNSTTGTVDVTPLAYVSGTSDVKKDKADGGARTSYRTKTAMDHTIIGEYGGKNAKGEVVDTVLSDEYMSYDPATKQLTIKDPSVRYVTIQFGVGKLGSGTTNATLNTGLCGVTYDLQTMAVVADAQADKPASTPAVSKPAATTTKASTAAVAKKAQTIKAAKTYTVKYSKVKKKAQKIAVKFKANGGGKITYKATKSGKVSIAKNGKVTVKKGTKKGTYTLKVKVTAAAKGNYKKTTSTVNLKVKVK